MLRLAAIVGKDITVLLERATQLENMTRKIIAEYGNHSNSNILKGLSIELKSLTQLAKDLRRLATSSATLRTDELNLAEEKLLSFENYIQSELEVAQEVRHFNATGRSADELINYGNVRC